MYGRKKPEMNRMRMKRLSRYKGIHNYGGEEVAFASIMKALQV